MEDALIANSHSKKILIVEDSPTQAVQLEHHLTSHGFLVASSRNGREALTQASADKPDLIITDVVMPEMDGFQLCHEIKSRDGLQDVPVILLTSLSRPQDVLRGLQSGANSFIRKPYDDRQLLSQIQYILLNDEIRKTDPSQHGIHLYFAGERYVVRADRQQILDLLISTYENALQLNEELFSNQAELATERDLLHTLMDNVPDFIYFKDTEGRFTRINRALSVAFGIYHASDATGRVASEFFSSDYARQSLSDDREILKSGHPIIGKVEYLKTRAGTALWVSTTKMLVRDIAGTVRGTFGVSRDMTQVKEAEERIRKVNEELERRVAERTSELAAANQTLELELLERKRAQKMEQAAHEQFRLLFAGNPLPMWVYDSGTGLILEANNAALTSYGFSSDEFLSIRTTDLEADERPPGQQTTGRRHKVRSGRVIEVEVIEHRIAWHDADATLLIARDVTEQKRLQKEFIQAQKMEAIGRLAAGVAHDFNNLLTVVNGYSGMLLDCIPKGDPLYADISEILRAGERAAGLTRQLLSYSRKSPSEAVLLDMNELVIDMNRMLRRVIGEDIELITTLTPALGSIKADSGQIEQVIMNLAVNARDAMPHGGKIVIETGTVHFEEDYASIHRALLKAGSYITLSISDTGSGMSLETQARIFEPFFTTKEPGHGTGLGLSTVFQIVEQAGGTINVSSEEGRGTTFRIYLPRAQGNASASEPEPQRALPIGTETVMLVEDQDIVRNFACRVLEQQGYAVLPASSGAEALSLSERHKTQIDLLVTDIVMPGIDGTELARRLLWQRPDLRVLYMSGYAHHENTQRGSDERSPEFLPKPFGAQSLARKVREVLDEPAPV